MPIDLGELQGDGQVGQRGLGWTAGTLGSPRLSARPLAAFPRLVHTWMLPGPTYNSSMFGWKMRFMKPILGDLYGYVSGSSTCTFQMPPSNGAVKV